MKNYKQVVHDSIFSLPSSLNNQDFQLIRQKTQDRVAEHINKKRAFLSPLEDENSTERRGSGFVHVTAGAVNEYLNQSAETLQKEPTTFRSVADSIDESSKFKPLE